MPAELTRDAGENGLLGSGSIGRTFCGCWLQVSQVPSSSETRSRLSLKRVVSLSLSPGTGLGIGDEGLGLGPGSTGLSDLAYCAFAANANMAISEHRNRKRIGCMRSWF